jgi:hypothetical protein
MELGYVSTNPEEPGEVSVVLDVERSMRFTVGAALGFGFVRIAADVNLGPVTTFSGGLRLGL